MIFILGGDGFVGSAYVRLLSRTGTPHVVITRANYDAYCGRSCDVLINANGNSKKFMADCDPLWEFDASVRSVVHSLHNFPADRYVFLSSGDVYSAPWTPENTLETVDLHPENQTRYGFHKATAESIVSGLHRRPLIIRLSGFVGPGLKKNPIFDMVQGDLVRLSPDSALQYITTDTAAELVWSLIVSGLDSETINLGGRGVMTLREIHQRLGSKSAFADGAPSIYYELNTEKLRALTRLTVPHTSHEIDTFLKTLAR